MMNQIPPYELDLITRYLSGEAGEEDISQLAAWLRQAPENEKLFAEYTSLWREIDEKIAEDIDIDNEWEKFNDRIEEKPVQINVARRTGMNFYMKMAAMLIILLIPAFFIYKYLSEPREMTLVASSGILEKELPDGTVVTMKEGSELIYSSENGKERTVTFQGQAYFRVAHDASRPFRISGNGIVVEVVGTSFMIEMDESTQVVLDTGMVALSSSGRNNEKTYLEPGQKAVAEGNVISVLKNDDRNYMSWKTKKFVFENDQLSTIVAAIEKVYGTKVILNDEKLAGCRVTATFDDQKPVAMLNVLKETLSLSMEKKGDTFVFSGTGCGGE